jgi:IclR family transcriptional regulator, KDG regulon repressor
VNALERGILVLEALASDEALGGGLGVTRIAELVGQDKSQVSRTLRTLDARGLVDRDPETRAYRLGWTVFGLAARAGETRLLAAGETIARELAHQLSERVHVSVLRGSAVLTILSHGAPHAIEAAGWVGRAVPAYCTSAGYALLLDADIEAILGATELFRLGPNTPRSLAEVAARVEAARTRGYAVADEDFEPGLVAVAAPVRDFRGRIAAALNVSAPKFRLAGRIEDAGRAVAHAAQRLSGFLGGSDLTGDPPAPAPLREGRSPR